MKKQLVLIALGLAAAGCSSDNGTGVASTNPDPASCNKGSIATGDTKTGTINSTSCVRYDHAYTQDSMYFDNYSFKAEKGKGYMFMLENGNHVTNWDAVLELVNVNPSTGEEQLLSISDDEGPQNYSRMYFIAPASGTFYLRAAGYGTGDTASYALTARSCDSPIGEITDTLAPSSQTLSSSDCVLSEPEFVDDSSHVKLFSVFIGPNETKTITVTSNDFAPGFQVFGPGWGTPCEYHYQGCGQAIAEIQKSNTESVTITANGENNCNGDLLMSTHGSASAVMANAGMEACEFFNWPGQYTVAVGSDYAGLGSFSIAVSAGEPPPPPSRVHPDAPLRNPTLDFLTRKPLRANQYFRTVR